MRPLDRNYRKRIRPGAWLPWLAVALIATGVTAHAGTLPFLPQVSIDTTYAPPSGNTISVNAGGSLQTALNNAQPGDTIVLQAGATFTGPFTLPSKAGSGWIYIRSSAYSTLPPPGTRVTPTNASSMPKIVGTSAGTNAIRTASGARQYRFVGIEIKPASGNFLYNLVQIGSGDASTSTLPSDIVFDRCYIHGDPSVGGRRGVAMDGKGIAVVDSHVSDFKEAGADTQALWAYNTPGPIKIANNYLEAAGENVMFGGADPAITNVTPSDIEIRGNHFSKPLAWRGTSWTVKNLLEFKNAQRVLVEGNIFENSWAMGQVGFAILVTPRNQDGRCAWCVTRDITIRLNRIRNAGGGVNILGTDDTYASQPTTRILVENNLFTEVLYSLGTGRLFQILGASGGAPSDVSILHNTGFSDSSISISTPGPIDRLDFRNNLFARANYGFFGDAVGEGTSALNAIFRNWAFVANAIIGGPSGSYPSGNFFPTNTGAVQFVNYAGGNYRLAASSPYKGAATDGRDIGADIDALESAIAQGGGGGTSVPAPTNLRITALP